MSPVSSAQAFDEPLLTRGPGAAELLEGRQVESSDAEPKGDAGEVRVHRLR
jgi:hypothetical protein